MYGSVASMGLLRPADAPNNGVVLLCGFDGVDGATTAPDESLLAHTLAFQANAQIDTAQSKFGGASLLLAGGGDAVIVPNSPDFLFGDGQFTVEGFVRWSSIVFDTYLFGVFDISGGRSWVIRKEAGGSGNWQFIASTAGVNQDTPINVDVTTVTGQWYHFAADRDAGGVLRLYRDGVMLGKATYASELYASPGNLSIGCLTDDGDPSGGYHRGWVDEVRITRGAALYASDGGFTVPTSPYPRP
ncbi:LamG domain-containing protein [Sinorhizobium americanum]|uniref:Concanavalin A-like lectin/glucanase superfamily protein n=1 Tax=Sinorhizobium americanum TaxID=194963 RepID=A0A4R2BU42_9HYPH|nr:LamG domain-containing protein [Sinorhizobium americanum]TCN30353.1 concanavalin A-like lectin/glucanase superfamily protein [Sinorhizobium americanum]